MPITSSVTFAAGDKDYIAKLTQLVTDINAATLGGTFVSLAITGLGTILDSTGLNACPIGVGTKSSGAFTTLSASGAASLSSDINSVGINTTNNTEQNALRWFDSNSNLLGRIVGKRGASGNIGSLEFYTSNANNHPLTLSDGGASVSGAISASTRFNLPSYTVLTLPAVGSAGGEIYVSDETGGAVPAFSDGANWRRVTDRAVVS